jgi:hypothetical protein
VALDGHCGRLPDATAQQPAPGVPAVQDAARRQECLQLGLGDTASGQKAGPECVIDQRVLGQRADGGPAQDPGGSGQGARITGSEFGRVDRQMAGGKKAP